MNMFDLNDLPSGGEPAYVGCWVADGYVHDAQCVTYRGPHAAYRGKELCVTFAEDSVGVVDVSEVRGGGSFRRVSSMRMRDYNPGCIAARSHCYTHQGWLTEDHRYLVLDDEMDELKGIVGRTTTYIIDLADLENPRFVGEYTAAFAGIDHNQYTKGGYVYQSNYC